jgi:hypothetical protein
VVNATNATSFLPNGILDTLSVFGSAMNSTANAMADAVIGSLKARTTPEATVNDTVNSTVVEWVKGVLRREWRISCLDVVIRL